MKRIILFILITLPIFGYSQTGGKKKEGIRTIKRGLFYRAPKTSPWIYKKTKPGTIQNREFPKLFKRNRTFGKQEFSKILERQNRLRAKRRIRGNNVFHKRKYF